MPKSRQPLIIWLVCPSKFKHTQKRGRPASFFSTDVFTHFVKKPLLIRTLIALSFLGVLTQAAAVDSVRTQEIKECRDGEIATWPDGKDRSAVSSPLIFVFDPDGTPDWFERGQVLAMVQRAADGWSACGIPSQVMLQQGATAFPQGAIRIEWSEKESRGNFGLANLGQRSLSLAPSAFGLLRQRNPAHDARQTLQMVLSHEMGHFYGLMAHSRRCVDVLSYYNNDKGEVCFSRDPSQLRSVPEYRHNLPTACDIERCRRANGTRQH